MRDPVVDALAQVSFAVVGELTRVAAGHDLSLTQLRLLAILRDREPRMAELADHLGLDRSTVSGLIDRAAAHGLVERVADPDDRRSSRVRLTAAGQRLAAAGGAEVGERIAALTEGLSGPERRTLTGLLERILAP